MKHDEDELQIACVNWFGMQYPKLSKLLHHSPMVAGEMQERLQGLRKWVQEQVSPIWYLCTQRKGITACA